MSWIKQLTIIGLHWLILDVYAMVGITPRSGYRRSGNARSENTRGAFPYCKYDRVHLNQNKFNQTIVRETSPNQSCQLLFKTRQSPERQKKQNTEENLDLTNF